MSTNFWDSPRTKGKLVNMKQTDHMDSLNTFKTQEFIRLKYFCVTQILSPNITSLHMHVCHILLVSIDFVRNDPGPKRLTLKIGRNDPPTKAERPTPKIGRNDPGLKRPGFPVYHSILLAWYIPRHIYP